MLLHDARPLTSTTLHRFPTGPAGTAAVITAVALAVLAVEPVAAQSNPICQDTSGTLPQMVEGFLQITTGLGIMGVLLAWQADALAEMFTLNRDQKEGLKRHKRQAGKSGIVLVALGPLATVAGPVMGLPVASCVSLVPF